MKATVFALLSTVLVLTCSAALADDAADAATAQRIAQAIKESGRLKGYRLDIKCKDGAAWLLGSVSSPDQLGAATQIANRVGGVDQVFNGLEVMPVAPDAPAPPRVQSAARGNPLRGRSEQLPRPIGRTDYRQAQPASYEGGEVYGAEPGYMQMQGGATGAPMPMAQMPAGAAQRVNYDHAVMPNHAWPSYAAHPNYAALTYPKQYSPSAWPYIGPFYPYPQVPLGWRKVTLEWDDGWWMLDFHE